MTPFQISLREATLLTVNLQADLEATERAYEIIGGSYERTLRELRRAKATATLINLRLAEAEAELVKTGGSL
jgi:hypothetical protein